MGLGKKIRKELNELDKMAAKINSRKENMRRHCLHRPKEGGVALKFGVNNKGERCLVCSICGKELPTNAPSVEEVKEAIATISSALEYLKLDPRVTPSGNDRNEDLKEETLERIAATLKNMVILGDLYRKVTENRRDDKKKKHKDRYESSTYTSGSDY
jgi:ribosomal protein S13